MKLVKEIVGDILKSKQISKVYFVGCGGSLSGFFPAKYFLCSQACKLKVGYINSGEFVFDAPKEINSQALVILASHRGNTAETVAAAHKAKELGAVTVGLTFQPSSPLADAVDYVIHYQFGEDSIVEYQKSSFAFKLAVELLNQVEGYDQYDQMVTALGKLHFIVANAKKEIMPKAIRFAWDYKDDPVIYTLGSGASWGSAHQESICIFMEMQWIHSSVIHSGEFFHGPFEITDKNTPYLMLRSTGNTRALDDRALKFLEQFNCHVTVLDGMEYGMDELGSMSGYLDGLFYTNVLGVFNKELAQARNHPLSVRRYMWKFDY